MPAQKFTDEARKYFMPHLWRQDEPDAHTDLKYDPQFGFDNEREPLKIKATFEEMASAHLPPLSRKQCAHIHIAFRTCLNKHNPLWWRCNGIMDELQHCYYEGRVHDMKEYERERRLNARERKLKETELS